MFTCSYVRICEYCQVTIMTETTINGHLLDNYRRFRDQVNDNPGLAIKRINVEGTWQSAGTAPHMKAYLNIMQGKFTVEFDEPDFLGGTGQFPNPNQYCIAGAIACYAATFTKWAGMEGIKVDSMTLTGYTDVDLHKNLGLGDLPVVKDVFFDLDVKSNASQKDLDRIRSIADERCPAVYCLTHPLNVQTSVKKGRSP
jgi:uncharacterized OsmC-like protein